MSTTAVGKQVRTVTPARSNIFAGRQGRKLREALLAYLFLFPAFLIIGLFGLFPLLFAAYQSTLVGLNRIVGRYDGLNNYVRAIDNLTYVLFFWLAALLVFMALRSIMQAAHGLRKAVGLLDLGPVRAIIGAGFILFVLFIFRALPAVLEVPQRCASRRPTGQLPATASPSARRADQQALWCAALYRRRHRPALVHRAQALETGSTMPPAFSPAPGHAAVRRLPSLAYMDRDQRAYSEALEAGEGLDIWSRSSRSAPASCCSSSPGNYGTAPAILNQRRHSPAPRGRRRLLASAWFLIGELPRHRRRRRYVVVRLACHALLLNGHDPDPTRRRPAACHVAFQDIWGKSVFRIIYFVPYIAPFGNNGRVPHHLLQPSVSPRQRFPAQRRRRPARLAQRTGGHFPTHVGRRVNIAGVGRWAEPGPGRHHYLWHVVLRRLQHRHLPGWPGQHPRELYEAASIDGGGRWAQFRHITLPLSPPSIS